MTEHPIPDWLTPQERKLITARELVKVSIVASESLARIARAYEQHVTGRCDADRLIEVVRQEVFKADRKSRQARRRSRPVRG